MPLFALEKKDAGEDDIKCLLIRAQSKTGARMIAKEYNGIEWMDPEKVTIQSVRSIGKSEVLIVAN